MTGLALLSRLVLIAADPCSSVAPLEHPDPAEAAAYFDVGEQERVAGNEGAAAVAFQEALRRDPAHARARAGLALLCQRRRESGADGSHALEEGVIAMEGGDCRRAVQLLERAPPSPTTQLLLGICRYELGDDAGARASLGPLLGNSDSGDTARLFLGLVALREGDDRLAQGLFYEVSSAGEPSLRNVAQSLSRAAAGTRRLVLSTEASAGYDSNVTLSPGGVPAPSGDRDFDIQSVASALYRPMGREGPFVRLTGEVRKQQALTAYDFLLGEAAAGYRLTRAQNTAAVEYAFGAWGLGGATFLTTHRLSLTGMFVEGPWSMQAAYRGHYDRYEPLAFVSYTGFVHEGEVEVARALDHHVVSLGFQLNRVMAALPELRHLEQGPVARARLNFGPVHASLETFFLFRAHDTFDPDFQVTRDDHALQGSAVLEYDMGASLTWQLSVVGRRAFSNVPELAYSKVSATVGARYALGLF